MGGLAFRFRDGSTYSYMSDIDVFKGLASCLLGLLL